MVQCQQVMPKNIFAYGTLMNPEIVTALTGKSFASKLATISDYCVCALPQRPYPGMIKKDRAVAKGLALIDVDDRSLRIISDWEDSEYQPRLIQVTTSDNEALSCLAFIWMGQTIDTEWDNNTFREQYMSEYIKSRIPGFLATSNYN